MPEEALLAKNSFPEIDHLFQFFIENQEDIAREYNGKHVVISEDKIVGSYDSHPEAYYAALNTLGLTLGQFIIQLAEHGEDAYTAYLHSSVQF
jgi:hypothetical protein